VLHSLNVNLLTRITKHHKENNAIAILNHSSVSKWINLQDLVEVEWKVRLETQLHKEVDLLKVRLKATQMVVVRTATAMVVQTIQEVK
jgi:hypothetical protein